MTENPLITKDDVVELVADFAAGDRPVWFSEPRQLNVFLFLAPVSRKFRKTFKGRLQATCPFTPHTTESQLRTSLEHGFPRNRDGISLARVGKLALLQLAVQLGCPINCDVCTSAARGGHLDVLQWLRRAGCHLIKSTCAGAAGGGHLEVLQWARANRCPWDKWTCNEAAEGGHLGVLQWARENGCDWDDGVLVLAAGGGHLGVLQWAVENGCDWQAEWACTEAARGGHLSVVQWLIGEGFFVRKDAWVAAASQGHLEVLEWAVEVAGYELDERKCLRAANDGFHDDVVEFIEDLDL